MTPWLWLFLMVFQTTIIVWLGLWLIGRGAGGVLIGCAASIGVIAMLLAFMSGLPVWRDRPFGDAYDHAALAWVAACAGIGFHRWLAGMWP